MKTTQKYSLLLAILTIGSMGTGYANNDQQNQPKQSRVQRILTTIKNHKGKIIAGVATVAALGLGYWYRENVCNCALQVTSSVRDFFTGMPVKVSKLTIENGVQVYATIDDALKDLPLLN